MEKIPVIELERLGRDLDIFTARELPEPELLTAGLYPPLPVSGSKLVWGFRLLEQAKRIGLSELSVVNAGEHAVSSLLCIALMLENRAQLYEWDELERIVSLSGGIENIIENIDENLGRLLFGRNPRHGLERLTQYTRLSVNGKLLVKQLGVEVKTAAIACTLSEEAQKALLSESGFQNLTSAEKRIFVRMCAEVARRDKLSGSKEEELVRNALSSKSPVAETRKKRFPGLLSLETRLRRFSEYHLKGSGIEVAAPPNFEGDRFFVSFSFTCAANFKNKLMALKSIEDKVDELFELL